MENTLSDIGKKAKIIKITRFLIPVWFKFFLFITSIIKKVTATQIISGAEIVLMYAEIPKKSAHKTNA